MTDRHSKQLLK